MTRLNASKKRQSVLSPKALLWMRAFSYFSSAALVSTFLAYLVCMNDMSVRGFEMRELSRQAEKLKDEKIKLELEIMTRGSLDTIDGKISSLGLVKADSVEYVSIAPKTVARR